MLINNLKLEELNSNALYFVNQIKNNKQKELIKSLKEVEND